MTDELKPCPFCGGEAQIVCCDDEGNIHGDEYAKRPYSGLGYKIRHANEDNEDCPIASYSEDGAIMGVYIYDSEKEAIKAWNRRSEARGGEADKEDFCNDGKRRQEKTERYIKLEKAIETLCYNCSQNFSCEGKCDEVVRLSEIPTADVREVKHGKWIKCTDEEFRSSWLCGVRCSICGYPAPTVYGDYCSICGARMDKEE